MWSVWISLLLSAPLAEATPQGQAQGIRFQQQVLELACDALPKTEVCPDTGCRFKDSSGKPFELASEQPLHLFELEWAFYGSALYPVAQSQLSKDETLPESGRDLWRVLSGFAPDLLLEDERFRLNPALARWALDTLLPTPETPMCGASAGELYHAGLGKWLDEALLMREHLHTHLPKRLKGKAETYPEQLAVPGKAREICQQVIVKGERQVPQRSLCQFWIRRLVAGDDATWKDMLSQVQKRYVSLRLKPKTLKPVRTLHR